MAIHSRPISSQEGTNRVTTISANWAPEATPGLWGRQGVAQHLLQQGTGKAEGGTGQQADGEARQPAEMDHRLAGILQLRREQGLPPGRRPVAGGPDLGRPARR